MNYWKLVYFSSESKDDYETKEIIITDDQKSQVDEALKDGDEFIIIKDKPTIKRAMIARIEPANDIVAEHRRSGTLHLIFPKAGDLPEPTPEAQEGEKKRRQESKERGLKKLGKWVREQPWYKKPYQEKEEETEERVSIDDLGEDE